MAIEMLEVSARSGRSATQAGPPEPESFVEAARLQTAVKEELATILSSTSFSSSKKSCEFLGYIVQVALDGRIDSLKERSIGLDLLGRDTSYDPSSDATVRVRANDVRKRLKSFYSTQPAKSGYRIELLPGSYSPRFVYVTEQTSGSEHPLSESATEQTKTLAEAQSIVPPISLVGITRPTFIALFICALFLRQQIMSGDPYHQFWDARLQGKTAMIFADERPDRETASNDDLQAILPLIWLAGRYDLKPVMSGHDPKDEPKPGEFESYAAMIHSSLATPYELAKDKRLRYRIVGLPKALHLVDQFNPALPDEHGAILTVLPEHPAILWMCGTDGESINRLAKLITSKDTFPAQLNEGAMAGHVVQAVLRDSSPQVEFYIP
ncbi:hypothetical protein [Edaphobacter flagellatus]|uniref:hypothetical protein n=1 Tax=Edaphobacter flagellatus TaxID=1933044 RepID=UPI0021B18681|nr:hypothetical protein [Edaphobacter flagellatus]